METSPLNICGQKRGPLSSLLKKIGTARSGISPIDCKIYWHIGNFTPDMDKYKVILAFEKAFKVWQEHLYPISFESTSESSKAAIRIFFKKNGDKGLPATFDSNTLAFAYFPSGQSLGIHSDMYFNDSYQWAEMHSPNQINLFVVAVHEMGHALGLDHSNQPGDVMLPTYQPGNEVVITQDTLNGIEKLYKKDKAKCAPVDPTQPPEPKPTPPESVSLVAFVKKLFPNAFWLRRLYEHQVIIIGEQFGLPVSKSLNKVENVVIVDEYLQQQ